MANTTIPGLPTQLTSVDRAADLLEVSDTSDAGNSKKSSVNNLLDLTSHPVGVDDVQTLTNKTVTAPAISSPVLSGTVTGTYTLGGTPTLPSAVVTLTGSQTLTNKVLTSPTINSPTITNPTITVDTISEFTAANGVTIDGLNIKDSVVGVNGVATASIQNSAVDYTKVAAGFPVQQVSVGYSAVATGVTTTPLDDTIPQNTEGTEFMSLAITPKSATNILVVQIVFFGSNSAASDIVLALHQDTTANALSAVAEFSSQATGRLSIPLQHRMVAGTTSSTTFKLRVGSNGAGTITMNGSSGASLFSTVTKSTITITEYKV